MSARVYSVFDLNPITLVEDMVLEILETIDAEVDSYMGKIPIGHPLTEKDKALMAGDLDPSEAMHIGERYGASAIKDVILDRSKARLKDQEGGNNG